MNNIDNLTFGELKQIAEMFSAALAQAQAAATLDRCAAVETLRDKFAMAALQGFIANKARPTYFNQEDDAAYLYRLADAMMAERAK